VPVTCEFDSEKKLITMVVDGQISVCDLVAVYQDALGHEKFERDMNVIWDLSRINLTKVPVGDIRKIPLALNKFMPARGDNYKAALVTRNSLDFHMMRIYMSILKLVGSNFQIRLFQSKNDAWKWLDS